MPVTGAQLKAARELLGWTREQLAAEIRVSTSSVSKFEEGGPRPRLLALSAIKLALEAAGIEFGSRDRPGVQMRAAEFKNSDEAAIGKIPAGAEPYDGGADVTGR
jgi:transcriptional regulator with XRE-family HTH domain